MKTILPKIYFNKLVFELEFLQNTHLPPFLGSMFRGAFGWAFRNAICVTKKPVCDSCILKNECVYYKAFETELENTDIYFLKGVRKLPHPFVIHQPQTNKRDFYTGEKIELQVTILGEYFTFLPYLVYVFTKMGETGIAKGKHKFKVTNVFTLDFNQNLNSIYNYKTEELRTTLTPINLSSFETIDYSLYKKAVINFNTPLRLQNDGEIASSENEVTPNTLLCAIQRRYLAVSYLYCGQKDINNFWLFEEIIPLEIVSNNLKYINVERYSSRQQTTMDMGGLTGNIIIQGNFSKLGLLFHLGSFINIGKNSLFGNGGYTITFK